MHVLVPFTVNFGYNNRAPISSQNLFHIHVYMRVHTNVHMYILIAVPASLKK